MERRIIVPISAASIGRAMDIEICIEVSFIDSIADMHLEHAEKSARIARLLPYS